jgi:hypothetical protein
MHPEAARKARVTAFVPRAGEAWQDSRRLPRGERGQENSPVADLVAATLRTPKRHRPFLNSFLLGAGAQAEALERLGLLRAGIRLSLRRKGWNRVEVYASDGSSVGSLPAEDAQIVAEMLDAGAPTTARVRALVPSFRCTRVQLTIEVEPEAA